MNTTTKITEEKCDGFEDFGADQGKDRTTSWQYCTAQQALLGGAWTGLQKRESLAEQETFQRQPSGWGHFSEGEEIKGNHKREGTPRGGGHM